MAGKKKAASDESWGPYYDVYEKPGNDGFIYEQEVPSYREVHTPHGTYGVPAGQVLTFKDKTIMDGGEEVVIPDPVLTDKKSAKMKAAKKTDRLVEV